MERAEGYRAGFRTQREELSDARLPVEGSFPDWLRGTLFVNGPGQFEVGGESLIHWFDPLAMLRRFRFDDDGVSYANRFVRSRDFEYARRKGGVRTPFPGTPPDRSVVTRLRQLLSGTFPDNPVIGVQRLGGRFLAVTESPHGLAFDPETLETTGRVDLTAGLDSDLTLAHVHYDHDAETFWNLGVSYGRETTYTLFERPADGGAPTALSRLRFEGAPYVHSFALTERYAVLTINAFGLDATALLRGAVTGGTFLDAFGPLGVPTRFVVLDRSTGAHVRTLEAPPAFVYHHANAYERDGVLVVDLVAFEDERAVTELTLRNLRSDSPALPRGDLIRYRLPLEGGSAERRRLHRGPVEFPMVDYRRRGGRPHRYVYLAETADGSALPTAVTKVDVESGRVRRWREPGTYPGEPVFVPAPRSDAEDDGVLLSVLLSPPADRSELVCLDASTLSELGRAPLPHRLPYAFHGQFYGPPAPGRTMP
ncbi:carotenoid oxygenase family protein [Halegenticoccus tardaugens]|uniref:carotenoid oxygenase family protein n=1 Tax=Halegenticoccus tardaugens TaxID=2071624 RepID=UPI00100AC613|nr:carotenoid oxygenase family protein [Halegenticoccus tardaugens]